MKENLAPKNFNTSSEHQETTPNTEKATNKEIEQSRKEEKKALLEEGAKYIRRRWQKGETIPEGKKPGQFKKGPARLEVTDAQIQKAKEEMEKQLGQETTNKDEEKPDREKQPNELEKEKKENIEDKETYYKEKIEKLSQQIKSLDQEITQLRKEISKDTALKPENLSHQNPKDKEIEDLREKIKYLEEKYREKENTHYIKGDLEKIEGEIVSTEDELIKKEKERSRWDDIIEKAEKIISKDAKQTNNENIQSTKQEQEVENEERQEKKEEGEEEKEEIEESAEEEGEEEEEEEEIEESAEEEGEEEEEEEEKEDKEKEKPTYSYQIETGDNISSVTEEFLLDHAEQFAALKENQQVYVIDYITTLIENNPSAFDLNLKEEESVDHLSADSEHKVNFSVVVDKLDSIIKKAKSLTSQESFSAMENNDTIKEFINNNPDVKIRQETMEKFLNPQKEITEKDILAIIENNSFPPLEGITEVPYSEGNLKIEVKNGTMSFSLNGDVFAEGSIGENGDYYISNQEKTTPYRKAYNTAKERLDMLIEEANRAGLKEIY